MHFNDDNHKEANMAKTAPVASAAKAAGTTVQRKRRNTFARMSMSKALKRVFAACSGSVTKLVARAERQARAKK